MLIILIMIGLYATAMLYLRSRLSGGMGIGNVRRARRRPGPVIRFEEMTAQERREYGFRKHEELSPQERKFFGSKPSKKRV